MQLKKPAQAMQSSFKKKHVPLAKDNNCKSTKIYKKFMCSDKNCQENISMQPEMPERNMQLPKPAIRRLCSDKNCQSTRCYKKELWQELSNY